VVRCKTRRRAQLDPAGRLYAIAVEPRAQLNEAIRYIRHTKRRFPRSRKAQKALGLERLVQGLGGGLSRVNYRDLWTQKVPNHRRQQRIMSASEQ